MLTRALSAAFVPLLVLPTPGRPKDDGLTIQSAPQVQANVDCGHPPRADCLAGLHVAKASHQVAPVAASSPSTPPPAPPPPPTCHYESLVPQGTPALQASDTGGLPLADVQREVCPAGGQPVGTPFNFVTASSQQPVVTVKDLADQAYSRLTMPVPQIVMTPAADATQFVSLPIWLQLAPSSWAPKSTTVSAGGVSLTMTAVPESANWSMGDGTFVTCRGPGTPYPPVKPKDPMASSPDCGKAYATPSATQPQGSYPVSVTVHWRVTWSTTTGLAGNEPDLLAVASTRLRVAEIQALVTTIGA